MIDLSGELATLRKNAEKLIEMDTRVGMLERRVTALEQKPQEG